MRFVPYVLLACLVCFGTLGVAADVSPQWRPVRDEVYLQEVGYQVKADLPVQAVACVGESVYAAFPDGVRRLEGRERFAPETGAPTESVRRLRNAGGDLWAIAEAALYRRTDAGWSRMAEGTFTDVCEHAGAVWVSTPESLQCFDGASLVPVAGAELPGGAITALASYAETLYCLSQNKLHFFDGARVVSQRVVEWGALPDREAGDLLPIGNQLLVASLGGLGVLRGTSFTMRTGAEGLPWEECVCLAAGFDRGYWVGTTQGALRGVDGEFHYFKGPRWLPSDHVNGIAAGPHTVYIATDAGLGIIDYEPYTLLKKAAYYEQHLEAWGQKRMAFTHKLEWNPDKGGWVREISDNDVGWSTHFWAAMAFKYKVTGDEAARREAVAGFNALKWSEEITGIPGFPARAIWAVGETGNRATSGSGGYPAEWNPTPDGRWDWKGDTSSDETDAHFYYAGIFHDFVANDRETSQAREHVARIAGHILDNGWTLRDLDGKPTVWGRWDLDYFNSMQGHMARGLNGLGALTYMATAAALSGESRFLDAYAWAQGHGYLAEIAYQKLVALPPLVNHSDDRLAFYQYYTVLRYERDPGLRSLYRRSLERSWEIERIEHNPWFNFIYGALTGNDCEAGAAADHLRAWPLDLVKHAFDFTNRRDLHAPEGYTPLAFGERVISPRERGAYRWSSNPFELRGGSGHEVEDPSGWLDAYWMGRHYGMILAPETDNPALVSVPPSEGRPGAGPYDGPPMPNVLD